MNLFPKPYKTLGRCPKPRTRREAGGPAIKTPGRLPYSVDSPPPCQGYATPGTARP